MTTQTLFRLGALATMMTALMLAVGNLMYFSGAATTVAFVWVSIIEAMIQVFAVIAVYVAQARRGGVVTFLGFVITIIGLLFYLINSAGRMAFALDVLTQAQLEQAQQLASLAVLDPIATWAIAVGTVLFGFGISRAGVFPRWAGILLLLVGVMTIFDLTAIEYIWAMLSVIAWGWLGWALWASPTAASAGAGFAE